MIECRMSRGYELALNNLGQGTLTHSFKSKSEALDSEGEIFYSMFLEVLLNEEKL